MSRVRWLAPVVAALGSALRRRRRQLLRLAGWSPLEALPALLSGQFTARATDQGFLAGQPGVGLGWLAGLTVAVLVGAYGTYRVHRGLAEVVEPFRDELLQRAVDGVLHRSTVTGGRVDRAAVARITHQVEIVRDTFAGLLMVVRGFLFTAGAALLGLLTLSPLVALLVAPPLLLGLGLFAGTLPKMVTWQRRYVLADERLAERTTEVVGGRRDVVACGAERPAAAAVGAEIDAQAAAERALARMAALRGVSLAVAGWLPLVVLLVSSPWLLGQTLTTGAMLGALVYILHGLQPALYTFVRGLGGGGLRLAVTLDRLLSETAPPTTAAPPAAAGRTLLAPPTAKVASQLSVVLTGVEFRYGRHSEPVVRDLDLVVAPDDHLAIVGASGVGKSTLTALMAGMLRPQAGQVRVAGLPGGPVDPAAPELRSWRVLIPQEAYVFTGTLWENLTYLSPAAGPERVAEVGHLLGLDPLVARLGGQQAPVAAGDLSAGERQLIALVRAYLSPARLVLLDEATCHLDPGAEARVERAFAARPGALVVVAHRISSAQRAARVLVMDGGEVAVGDHAELLDRSPRYRELVGHWRDAAVAGRAPRGR